MVPFLQISLQAQGKGLFSTGCTQGCTQREYIISDYVEARDMDAVYADQA
jgi:hypothetical protein